MGVAGTFRCGNGHEFWARSGSLLHATQYRCDRCDRVEHVEMPNPSLGWLFPYTQPKAPGPCICGGTFKTGLSPKCPICGSRKTECVKVEALED